MEEFKMHSKTIGASLSLALAGQLYAIPVANPLTIDKTTDLNNYDAYEKDVDDGTLTVKNPTAAQIIMLDSQPSDNSPLNNIIVNSATAADQTLKGNALTMNGGTLNSINVASSQQDGTVFSENTLNLNGGELRKTHLVESNGRATATKNVLNLNGTMIYHGLSVVDINGGAANENTLNINGTKGERLTTTFTAAYLGNSGTADGNVLNINGGTIGDSLSAMRAAFAWGNSKLTNNVVNLKDADDLRGRIDVANIMWAHDGAEARDNVLNVYVRDKDWSRLDLCVAFGRENQKLSGNTFNVYGKNDTFKSIAGFEKLNFYLAADTANDETILNLVSGELTDISKATIGVGIANGADKLKSGDRVNLIKTASGIKFGDMANRSEQLVQSGLSTAYTFALRSANDDKDLIADVTKITINPDPQPLPNSDRIGAKLMAQNKNTLETGAAVLGAINQSDDILSGITDTADGTFAYAGGFNMRYNSGSYVENKGISVLAGAMGRIGDGASLGGYVETGGGKYESFNDFAVKGSGDLKYAGAGIVSEFDLAENFYAKSGAKIGRIKSDYEASLASGRAEYDVTRTYYGANLALGKIFELSANLNADVYVKGFYTHIDSKKTEVLGEGIKLEGIDSIRSRAGARFNFDVSDNVELFAGAAFEREFKGKIGGYNSTYAMDIDAASVKGNTAIGEIGAKYSSGKLDTSLKLEGLSGKKEGINAGLRFVYKF